MLWNWFGLGGRRNRRAVFAYRDGTRGRRADPVAVEMALIAALGADWKGVLRKLDQGPARGLVGLQQDAAEAEWLALRARVLAAIDAAFGVSPYSYDPAAGREGGLTDGERFDLLTGYCEFCADLIEMARPFVSAQSRDSPSPESPQPVSGRA